ncbi:MAG: hypothetical protein U0905_22380 [Pirellulales bacterium]
MATISSGVNIGAILFGEGGNDHLNAGKIASIVLGGDGDDMLIGGNGNDILIGGRGSDRIVGNGGFIILYCGYTCTNRNPSNAMLLTQTDGYLNPYSVNYGSRSLSTNQQIHILGNGSRVLRPSRGSIARQLWIRFHAAN